MMITVEQIRSARAWLKWSQGQLAKACGLSPSTIYNLEKGNGISSSVLKEIRKTLEHEGCQFIGTTGFRYCSSENKIYEGDNSCDEFYETLLATAKETGTEIAATFKSQEHFINSLGISNPANPSRLEQLAKYAPIMCLTQDLHSSLPPMKSVRFKTGARLPFYPLASFIYGNKTAMVIHNADKEFRFYIDSSIDTAQKMWTDFMPCWQSGLPTPSGENF